MNIYEKIALKYKTEAVISVFVASATLAIFSSYQRLPLWSWFTAFMSVCAVYTYSVFLFASFEKKRIYVGSILLGFCMCKASSFYSANLGLISNVILATSGSFLIYWGAITWLVSKAKWKDERFDLFLSTMNSLIILMIASGVYIEKWLPKSTYLALIYSVRDVLIFTSAMSLAIFQLTHYLRKHGITNPKLAIKFLFDEIRPGFYSFERFFLISVLSLIGAALNLFLLVKRFNDPGVLQDDFGLIWILAFSETIFCLILFRSEISQNKLATHVLPAGTKRFMNKIDRSFSVHTAAVPTFVFFYDIDFSKSLKNRLPATMYQIQNEDLRNSLVSLASEKISDLSHVGSLNQLVMDPSQCVSLAGESLFLGLMISLEISRSARQRSVMLAKILPILDHELSRISTPEFVEDVQKSAVGFYYLDFSWVDQHLMRGKRFSRVGSSFEPLPSYLQMALLKLRSDGLSIDNYVWLSESAKQRIVEEIPSLKSMIEMRPIKISDHQTEHVLYTIRFDQLASRLENSLDLKSKRQKVSDREPSDESLSLIETLNRRLSLVKGEFELTHLIRTIYSYQWSGFKEKDLALLLLMRIWSEHLSSLSKESQVYKNLLNLLVDCISEIGYPTKYLHSAQLRKNNFRSIGELRKAALDVSHDRFEESWSLLSSGAYGRISDHDVESIKLMITEVLSSPKVMSQKIVRNKIMDVACFLIARIERVSDDEVSQLIFRIFHSQASAMMDLEVLAMWLDRWQFVTSGLNRQLNFSQNDFEEIYNLIKKVEVYHQKNLMFLFSKLDQLRSSILPVAS